MRRLGTKGWGSSGARVVLTAPVELRGFGILGLESVACVQELLFWGLGFWGLVFQSFFTFKGVGFWGLSTPNSVPPADGRPEAQRGLAVRTVGV